MYKKFVLPKFHYRCRHFAQLVGMLLCRLTNFFDALFSFFFFYSLHILYLCVYKMQPVFSYVTLSFSFSRKVDDAACRLWGQ